MQRTEAREGEPTPLVIITFLGNTHAPHDLEGARSFSAFTDTIVNTKTKTLFYLELPENSDPQLAISVRGEGFLRASLAAELSEGGVPDENLASTVDYVISHFDSAGIEEFAAVGINPFNYSFNRNLDRLSTNQNIQLVFEHHPLETLQFFRTERKSYKRVMDKVIKAWNIGNFIDFLSLGGKATKLKYKIKDRREREIVDHFKNIIEVFKTEGGGQVFQFMGAAHENIPEDVHRKFNFDPAIRVDIRHLGASDLNILERPITKIIRSGGFPDDQQIAHAWLFVVLNKKIGEYLLDRQMIRYFSDHYSTLSAGIERFVQELSLEEMQAYCENKADMIRDVISYLGVPI